MTYKQSAACLTLIEMERCVLHILRHSKQARDQPTCRLQQKQDSSPPPTDERLFGTSLDCLIPAFLKSPVHVTHSQLYLRKTRCYGRMFTNVPASNKELRKCSKRYSAGEKGLWPATALCLHVSVCVSVCVCLCVSE